MDSKIIIKLTILFFISLNVNAATVNVPTTYSTNGQVTATNLNGNFDALESTLNGGLDNTNANTTTGYRFFETKSSLPTAGSQGRVIFLTTDNTLNFDNGSSFTKSVSVSSPANGDTLYYNSGWNTLAKGTNGQVLMLSSGIPSWQTVIPTGVIVMWSGTIATIPTGWYLCDGNNGTPNLTNRFIVGADADSGGVAKSTVTGSALQTSDGQIPAHTHDVSAVNTDTGNGGNITQSSQTSVTMTKATSSFGTGTKNVAVFYALAFIMKS